MATVEAQNPAKKTVCVVGGSGFLASKIIKILLQKGYSVNATVRDPENKKKISHLLAMVQDGGDLTIFKADLTDEESFDAPIAGCHLVFHVATPVNFASKDPENELIKPAIKGVQNVLKACVKAKTVKRVVLTSSAATTSINNLSVTGQVINEDDWTDVEFLTTAKPPAWGYPVSKTLAEKAAWKFSEEHNINLITVIPTLMTGPSLTSEIPSSLGLATSPITGNEFHLNALKGMQMLSGSISLAHVDDISQAHVFLAEKESASGRYICNAVNTSVPELAKFLSKRYPQFNIQTEFGSFPSKPKLIMSSDKLIKEGFSFKYGIEEMYDQTVEYLQSNGVLKN